MNDNIPLTSNLVRSTAVQSLRGLPSIIQQNQSVSISSTLKSSKSQLDHRKCNKHL